MNHFVPDASRAQIHAWRTSLEHIQSQGARVLSTAPSASQHSGVLEYMLPREAGRRTDLLVLQNGRVVVVEFKETSELRRADVDQAAAYARDLSSYHSACHELEVTPLLVLTGKSAISATVDNVAVLPADRLAETLVALGEGDTATPIDLRDWIDGEYAPLPTLITAARMLFEGQPLPFIRRAHSAGVGAAAHLILDIARRAASNNERHLVLLTGVPGAGKTLVGLQVAHSAALEAGYRFGARKKRGAPATFLSGNGPLVQVLQHALKSTAFVQDMHRYIREYGLEHPGRIPPEHLIVFDEAQRAWDREKIHDFYSKKIHDRSIALDRSEPDLLVQIAERIPDYSVIVALVGSGQEIHAGEEAGMAQWASSISTFSPQTQVHGPAALESLVSSAAIRFSTERALDLDVTLRSHAAADAHRWVEAVLDHRDFDRARTHAHELRKCAYPIYITHNLSDARRYAIDRFGREPQRRFGLLASSKAKNLLPYGIDPGFQATKQLKIPRWFNDDPASSLSCCQLQIVITEFQCQGLELDLPIVCWGDDFLSSPTSWHLRPSRHSRLIHDPARLRINAYRVLLTRGREGLIIFIPPTPDLDATHAAFLSSGALPLTIPSAAAI